jgi:predicted N-formylglutamate amidohydrolase
MKEEKRVITLDEYEHGVMVNALNELRNDLIEEQRSTDAVDDLLLKTIDAPTKKQKRRSHDEAR